MQRSNTSYHCSQSPGLGTAFELGLLMMGLGRADSRTMRLGPRTQSTRPGS